MTSRPQWLLPRFPVCLILEPRSFLIPAHTEARLLSQMYEHGYNVKSTARQDLKSTFSEPHHYVGSLYSLNWINQNYLINPLTPHPLSTYSYFENKNLSLSAETTSLFKRKIYRLNFTPLKQPINFKLHQFWFQLIKKQPIDSRTYYYNWTPEHLELLKIHLIQVAEDDFQHS